MADNIYVKLAKMRVELQRMNIKKSGWNDYSKYYYYELGDILPPINELQEKYRTCSQIYFKPDEAVMVLINADNPEEKMEFTSPMADLTLKAAHPVQNLGGVETYQRRYLYMTAFEIVENDYFDATQGKEGAGDSKPTGTTKPKKPAAKPKPVSKISEATANELNMRIREYSAKSRLDVKTITKDIINHIGKALGEMDEADAMKVLDIIKNWTEDIE